MQWQRITSQVLRFRDSCNVYVLIGPRGSVVIDAGSGRWLDHAGELPAAPEAVLCTHYFRDHSAGAALAAEKGLAIYVPEDEKAIFVDPVSHFARRETYVIYDNVWDLFVPIAPVRIAGVLQDYDTINLGGVQLQVVPLPGATLTQIGFLATLDDGRRIVFCGETIHSPGKVPRVAPLQYNYNDLPGAANVHYSAGKLRQLNVDMLLPSLGEPIQHDVDGALAELQQNMKRLCKGRPAQEAQLQSQESDPLVRVSENVCMSTQTEAMSWFLRSRNGKVLAIDYGYLWKPLGMPAASKPHHRRALLHSLDGLKSMWSVDRIDVVLVSHFHDDHVCGIPVLQRLFGTECWAGENFAELLEHPEAHCFPCNWPKPIKVHRKLPLNQPVCWEEYTFHLWPMNGHTRFSTLIGFEADGLRFAHTGDQYFFHTGITDAASYANNEMMRNFVYRNGALLNGYRESAEHLCRWRPDIIISGHFPAYRTGQPFFDAIAHWSDEYEQMHRSAMPLGESDTHFELDSWMARLWPYRARRAGPGNLTFTASVRNPFSRSARMELKLVGPAGWTSETVCIDAPPRAEIQSELTLLAAHTCRQQPIALDLVVNSQPFGQVAEAMVTVDEPDTTGGTVAA